MLNIDRLQLMGVGGLRKIMRASRPGPALEEFTSAEVS